MIYKQIIRPILFLIPPEKAHDISTNLFVFLCKIPLMRALMKSLFGSNSKELSKEVMGLKFANPIGLAAGFDKNAKLFGAFQNLGFGFIEVGTVTPKGQPGNPQPRMFRLPADKALINRLGFNNNGLEEAIKNLKATKRRIVVGGNIGKNKITPNDKANEDYLASFKALHPHVDYFTVNVSSPNTPNLRALQEKEPLEKLLFALQTENKSFEKQKPILLKIAPDMPMLQLEDIAQIVKNTNINGVIATNTTISRDGLKTKEAITKEAGGLSGEPVRLRSTEVVKSLRALLGKEKVIIAVGGVFTGADALEKINAGADLVQVYTGFVYEGPAMVNRINQYLRNHLKS